MNSTPTKKNVAAVEKKMILQHLVAPAVRRQSSAESVLMTGSTLEVERADYISQETSFTIDAAAAAQAAAAAGEFFRNIDVAKRCL